MWVGVTHGTAVRNGNNLHSLSSVDRRYQLPMCTNADLQYGLIRLEGGIDDFGWENNHYHV